MGEDRSAMVLRGGHEAPMAGLGGMQLCINSCNAYIRNSNNDSNGNHNNNQHELGMR